jgi:1-aminocyclopropane-1-carboxylate deaminase/D-cysteine desulfhydrase-like pyridoxal-dependent ACC family enzyme
LDQCEVAGVMPSHVVFTSSSGGTHAGLLAGRAAAAHAGRDVPDIVAIGVAKGVNVGRPDVAGLANQTLNLMRSTAIVADEDVEIDSRWIGDDYAVPTAAGDSAIRWAARHGGWLLDRTYSGKGCSGLLGLAAEDRFGSDVVFIHTGGWPALFAPDGVPA